MNHMIKKLFLIILIAFVILFWKGLVDTFSVKKNSKPKFNPSYVVLRNGNSLPLYAAIHSSGVTKIFFSKETQKLSKKLIPISREKLRKENNKKAFHRRIWSEICKNDLDSLIFYPLFPHLPKMETFTKTLSFNDLEEDSGLFIYGKLCPKESGIYKLKAVKSNVLFQVWFSVNEDPKQSKMIFDDNKLQSEDLELKSFNKYYLAIVIKVGDSKGTFSLKWSMQGAKHATDIPTDVLETYLENNEYYQSLYSKDLPILKDKLPIKDMYKSEANLFRSKIFHLPFMPEKETQSLFPSCEYSPSYLIKKKLPKYGGQWETHFSSIYPDDESDMEIFYNGVSKPHLIYGNSIVEKKTAEIVVQLVVDAITEKYKKYSLKRLLSLEENKDELKGDRYLVELELFDDTVKKSFRFSEYVYLPKDTNQLCYPTNFAWNKTAEVNLVITSAGQGRWLLHFINTVSRIFEETKDENFAVTIVDFDTIDNGVIDALKKSNLKKYTLIKRTGKFHKTLALNDAAASITNQDAIVTQVDLHLVIPSDFVDNIRKHTVKGRMAYSPLLNRLQCGSSPQKPTGFWEDEGYGIFGIYKSDWDLVGGMNARGFKDKWGGEDWELLDSVLNNGYEVERLKIKNFHHVYHTKKNMWSSFL